MTTTKLGATTTNRPGLTFTSLYGHVEAHFGSIEAYHPPIQARYSATGPTMCTMTDPPLDRDMIEQDIEADDDATDTLWRGRERFMSIGFGRTKSHEYRT